VPTIYLLYSVIVPTFYPFWSPVASHVDEEDANGSVDVVVVLTVQIIQYRLDIRNENSIQKVYGVEAVKYKWRL
jgi:hypothetical protein